MHSNQTLMPGRPTEPLARKLVDYYKHQNEGDNIPTSKVEQIIGLKRTDNRYRTIVVAARKMLFKETGVSVRAERGVGEHLCTAEEQLRLGVHHNRKAIRSLSRGRRAIEGIADDRPTADKHVLAMRDFQAQRYAHLEALTRSEAKVINLRLGAPKLLPGQENGNGEQK